MSSSDITQIDKTDDLQKNDYLAFILNNHFVEQIKTILAQKVTPKVALFICHYVKIAWIL